MNFTVKDIRQKLSSPAVGIAISTIFFLVLFCLIYFYPEERMLNEGAKELTSLLNKESFFLLHPERIFFVVSELFPYLAMKLGMPLNVIFQAYNLNLWLVSLLIYSFCIYQKDYLAGVYLSSFQIIGMTYTFWYFPFLEHVYSLLFCYLVFKILEIYIAKKQKWLLALVCMLIVLVLSLHPVGLLYLTIIIFLLNFGIKEKIIWAAYLLFFFIVFLYFTEVSVSNRIGIFDLSQNYFRLFVKRFPDLVLLTLVSFYFILKSSNRWLLIPVFMAGLIPFVLYLRMPIAYFMLPTGICLLVLAINKQTRANLYILSFIGFLFVVSINRINKPLKEYKQANAVIDELINNARSQTGHKFIIIRNDSTEKYFYLPEPLNLDEMIKHTSLLYSSISGEPVIIESLDFNKTNFSHEFNYTESDSVDYNKVKRFISDIYDSYPGDLLYPEFFDEYEYAKYFFTNKAINQRYFKIEIDQNYKMLDF